MVAPPSVHVSGKRYEWDGLEGENALLKLGDAPRWLLDRIAKETTHGAVRSTSRRRNHPFRQGSKLRPGARNNGLASAAGMLRRRGMTQAEMEPELLRENQERCDPPLDPDEVRQIAASIARYPAGPPTSGRQKAFIPPGYKSVQEAVMGSDVLAPLLIFRASGCSYFTSSVHLVMARHWIARVSRK